MSVLVSTLIGFTLVVVSCRLAYYAARKKNKMTLLYIMAFIAILILHLLILKNK